MTRGRLILIPSTLGDMSPQAQFPEQNKAWVEQLQYYFVENPKPARAFLKLIHPSIDLNKIEFFQFDKHQDSQHKLYQSIIELMNNGHDVGVLSDAGCPGIADPGSGLVEQAHKHHLEVIPLVGPSSVLLTLMGSGLNGQRFQFIGYLPKDQAQRLQLYKKISDEIRRTATTFLFIETPYHAEATFQELMKQIPGEIRMVLGIDLMSVNQTVQTRSMHQWVQIKNKPLLKGRQVVFGLG